MDSIKNGLLALGDMYTRPKNSLLQDMYANTAGGAAVGYPALWAQGLRARESMPRKQLDIADSMALASALPVVGDVFGLASDAYKYATQPESRNLLNYGLTALSAIPLIPAVPKSYSAMSGTKDEIRGAIRQDAERLAEALRAKGFDVSLNHSGSAAGPSSYLSIFDPQTGRYFKDPIRLSNHGKGAFNAQFVNDISSPAQIDGILRQAEDMRAMGRPSGMEKIEAAAAEQAAKTRTYWEGVAERAMSKQTSGQPLSNRERQALDWVSRNAE